MIKMYPGIKRALLSAFLLSCVTVANAQLKIGDNPTTINKASILELESTKQGLLLPRLTDTVAINALTPPDGMMIYLTTDKSLRLRSNGSWKKIADLSMAASNWALTGNSGTDSTLNFMGTSDSKPLIMKTNNAERLHISANGNIGIGTATPSANLDINGSVKLQSITTDTTLVSMLVLGVDGTVYKRNLAASTFQNAIKAINGLQKQTLSIRASASTSTDTVAITNNAADSSISITMPIQDGASGANKAYGFLTYADWQKIQSTIQTLAVGAVAASSDIKGITIDSTANTRTLILHPADAINPGIVTAGTQTFGGNKTLNGNTTLAGTVTMSGVSVNNTLDSVLVINNGLIQKRQLSQTAFGNTIRSLNGNSDTAQKIVFHSTGTDLTVTANGIDSVFLNVPNAAAAARGVVSTIAQTFAGNKTFQDSMVASKTVMVGNTGFANSTLQVNGSLAMAITTVSANYTAAASDNTILANTTTGGITVTLPSPTSIAGRIYTIKKIGTGGIDNQLTVTPTSGTIDGGGSFNIYNDWTYVSLQTDGSNWYIIKK